MWWKLPLLLLLGAPFALRAWKEVQNHPESVQPRSPLPSRDGLAARKGEQKKLAAELEAPVIDEDLARAVLHASQEPVARSPRRPRDVQDAVNRQDAHAEAVKQVWLFAETYAELERDPNKGTTCATV